MVTPSPPREDGKEVKEQRTIQALARGTMWSMSTDDDDVTVCPSYGLYHDPDVGWHALFTLTPVPSRRSTISLPCRSCQPALDSPSRA